MKYPKGTIPAASALVLPFAVVLLLHARYYWPFISDDALISLRYVQRLLAGNGLTWTDGHPVEGYSNLLWILLVALLAIVRVDVIDAARILGVACTMVVLLAISYWHVTRNGVLRSVVPVSVALAFLVLGAPTAVWSIGGLEQPLCAALLAVSIVLMYSVMEGREPTERTPVLWLSFVEGLLCLARPDGPIFVGAAAASLLLVGWLARRRRMLWSALLVLLFPVLFYGGQLLFRVVYYGELVPNTALVKFAPSSSHLSAGLSYLAGGFKMLAPLSVLALASLVGLLLVSATRARALCLLLTATAWSAYLALIGGDLFPAYRHFVPLMVVFAFALAEAVALPMPALVRRPARVSALVGLVLLLFVPYTSRQFTEKNNRRAIKERWEWDGKELGLLLKTAFAAQQPLLAVTAAGCLPYWSELPALDMLGLNDYYLPRHRPADFGRGWVGHELGDGQYVLDRRPDIIVFSVGTGPAYRSGEEMDRTAEFHDWYVPVKVTTTPSRYEAIVYIDRYSPKIGLEMTESAVVVPGFLFGAEGTAARLNRFNKLVVPVASDRPVKATFRCDPRVRWLVDVRAADHAPVASELKQEGWLLSITLSSSRAEPVDVEEVVLRRAPGTAGDASTASAAPR